MTKDWVHGVGHPPACKTLLQIVVRAVITSSLQAWTSSAGMLSIPADFPFFNDCTAASTSLRRMGWPSSVSVWRQFSTDESPLAHVVVQLRAVVCSSVQHLSLFCEAFSRTILDSSRFLPFHSGQVFHHLVCPLTVILPQILFSLTTLFSYPVFCSFFHASLYVVIHFFVFFRSFRLIFFLSQFSPFVAQIKNLCSDTGFVFLLTMFAKNLTGCFSHCCIEGGDH